MTTIVCHAHLFGPLKRIKKGNRWQPKRTACGAVCYRQGGSPPFRPPPPPPSQRRHVQHHSQVVVLGDGDGRAAGSTGPSTPRPLHAPTPPSPHLPISFPPVRLATPDTPPRRPCPPLPPPFTLSCVGSPAPHTRRSCPLTTPSTSLSPRYPLFSRVAHSVQQWRSAAQGTSSSPPPLLTTLSLTFLLPHASVTVCC